LSSSSSSSSSSMGCNLRIDHILDNNLRIVMIEYLVHTNYRIEWLSHNNLRMDRTGRLYSKTILHSLTQPITNITTILSNSENESYWLIMN